MVSTGRRQLGLPVVIDGRQCPQFPKEVMDQIREAMTALVLQVSDAELHANDQTEEADDESAR